MRRAMIYHGPFGSALFQRIYAPDPVLPLMLGTSLAYHAFVVAPLILLSLYFDFIWPLALVALAIPTGVCALAAAQAKPEALLLSLYAAATSELPRLPRRELQAAGGKHHQADGERHQTGQNRQRHFRFRH